MARHALRRDLRPRLMRTQSAYGALVLAGAMLTLALETK